MWDKDERFLGQETENPINPYNYLACWDSKHLLGELFYCFLVPWTNALLMTWERFNRLNTFSFVIQWNSEFAFCIGDIALLQFYVGNSSGWPCDISWLGISDKPLASIEYEYLQFNSLFIHFFDTILLTVTNSNVRLILNRLTKNGEEKT